MRARISRIVGGHEGHNFQDFGGRRGNTSRVPQMTCIWMSLPGASGLGNLTTTAPSDPQWSPTSLQPRTSNTRLDSIFVEGILNLRPRHSIRPHIKQTIWGQMDFPHIIVKLSLCCGFQHFWHNNLCRYLLKLFSLVALLALQVPLQYRISREGDALVLRDPKCELVLSWTAPLC